MERLMQQLKDEELCLKRATQKNTLLDAQRQKVQNLRGITLVNAIVRLIKSMLKTIQCNAKVTGVP